MKRPRPTTLEPLAPAVFVVVVAHLLLAASIAWLWQGMRQGRVAPDLVWLNPLDFHDPVAAANPPKAVLIRPPLAVAPAVPKAAPKAAPAVPKKPAPVVETPVAKATLIAPPPQQQAMPVPVEGSPLFAGAAMPKPAANRSITLRRAPPKPKPAVSAEIAFSPPPLAGATLADMARLNTFRPANPLLPPLPMEESNELPTGLNMDAVDDAVNKAFYAAWSAPPLDAVPVNQRSAQMRISIAKDGRVFGSQMSGPSGSHALDNSILGAAAQVTRIDTTLPSHFPKESYDLELNFNLLP